MRPADAQPTDEIVFRGRRFFVSPDAPLPGPGAELLVEVALEEGYEPVLELGTGSGVILLSLVASRLFGSGVGVDESETALALARRNHDELGVARNSLDLLRQVRFRRGQLYDGVPTIAGTDSWAGDVRDDERVSGYGATGGSVTAQQFDLIVATPAVSNHTTLNRYGDIATGAQAHLKRGGRLIVEVEPRQARSVAKLCTDSGFDGVEVRSDEDGADRVVIARHPTTR